MNKIEKEADIDTLIQTLDKDCIERNTKLDKFIKFLNAVDGNSIVSLDGEWGSGKTYFIKQSDLIINYCNASDEEATPNFTFKQITAENKEKIDKILCKNEFNELENLIKDNCINSLYFNAWEHDDEEDPILSIIYGLIEKFPNALKNENKYSDNSILDGVKLLVKILSGGNIDIDNINDSRDLLENIKQKYTIKEKIQNIFDLIIDEHCNKLVLFVDELDRCNPLYAVKMLERIKHYVTDERIVIVISTNLKELSNTIGKLYGNKETAMDYLDKFIDYRLVVPKCNLDKYYKSIYPVMYKGSYWYNITLGRTMKYKNMSLRQINRYIAYMKLFEKNLFSNVVENKYWHNEKLFLECLIIPYIVGLFIADYKEYKNFMNGKGLEEFIKYGLDDRIEMIICSKLKLDSNEKDEEYKNIITRIYEYIWSDEEEPLKFNSYILSRIDILNIINYFNILDELSDFSVE